MIITPFDNKIITTPGIYSGVPIDDYHGNPFICDGFSISSSGLKKFIERPSLYWAYSVYNPEREPEEYGKSLNLGVAAHTLLLGESGFAQRFALRPETYPNDPSKKWNANSNDCKAWLEEQEAAGKRIITTTEINHIRGMKRSLEAHPAVQNGILNGLVEHSMFAKFGKIWVRARPDVIPLSGADFADPKTTARVSYEDLEKAIYNFGYHIQAAVVRMVARQVMGDGFEFGSFFFAFIETKPPYDVRIVELRSEDMDIGEQQVRAALVRLEKCIARNEWPGEEGFEQSISPISMPSWAKTRIQNEMQYQEQAA